MTYEYENGMGYLLPAPRRVVEVYGTMPEAQEYIQEEFGLPYLPPAHALSPPTNPRTDPYRRVTVLPIEPALGIDQAPQSFFERYKGWFIAAGAIAGGYLIGKGLANILNNRPLFANPPIKDVKYQEAGQTGYIPAGSGEAKPFNPAKLRPPGRYRIVQDYVDACLEINPNALEVKKRPGKLRLYRYDKKTQEAAQQAAIESTKTAYLKILKAGRNLFAPEDWVGNPKLYYKFRSFALIPSYFNEKHTLVLPVLSTTMRLWIYLGMPSGSAMTERGKATIDKDFQKIGQYQRRAPEGEGFEVAEGIWVQAHMRLERPGGKHSRAAKLVKSLDDITATNPNLITPRIVWQLLNIQNADDIDKDDLIDIILLLKKTPIDKQWRIRWYYTRLLRDNDDFVVEQDDIATIMALPEREFIKQYGEKSVTSWARLYGRKPTNRKVAALKPKTIASLPMKAFLRAMRSQETFDYIEGEKEKIAKEAYEERYDFIKDRQKFIKKDEIALTDAKNLILQRKKEVQNLKNERRKLLLLIKELEEDKKEIIKAIGEDAYFQKHSQILEDAYVHYENLYKKMAKILASIHVTKKEIAKIKERISSTKRMIRISAQQIENLKKDRDKVLSRSIRDDYEQNRVQAAVGLSIVFGQNWKGWLKKMARRGINFHDATYWLPIVESPGFGEYITKYWQAPLENLSVIGRGWNELTEEERKMRPKELKTLISSRVYGGVIDERLAFEAARWGIPEEEYYNIEKRWNTIQDRYRTGELSAELPPVNVQVGKYRMYLLTKDDPRSLFLGEHSDCCQTIGNAGETCAWFGVESPESGFYVIEDDEERIVAQSWAWLFYPYLIFDSIEGKGLAYNDDRKQLLSDMYEQAAEQIMDADPRILEVRTGIGRIDIQRLERPWPLAEKIVDIPKSYGKIYSDASTQQYIIGSRMGSSLNEGEQP